MRLSDLLHLVRGAQRIGGQFERDPLGALARASDLAEELRASTPLRLPPAPATRPAPPPVVIDAEFVEVVAPPRRSEPQR